MIYTSNASDQQIYVNTNDDQVINWYLLHIKIHRHTNKSKALMFKSNKTSKKHWAQHKCINVHLIELYQKEGEFFFKKITEESA